MPHEGLPHSQHQPPNGLKDPWMWGYDTKILGACCEGSNCLGVRTEYNCHIDGGEHIPPPHRTFIESEQDCYPNPCPGGDNFGACCLDEEEYEWPGCSDNPQCVHAWGESNCAQHGGIYKGDGTRCFQNPCGRLCHGCDCLSSPIIPIDDRPSMQHGTCSCEYDGDDPPTPGQASDCMEYSKCPNLGPSLEPSVTPWYDPSPMKESKTQYKCCGCARGCKTVWVRKQRINFGGHGVSITEKYRYVWVDSGVCTKDGTMEGERCERLCCHSFDQDGNPYPPLPRPPNIPVEPFGPAWPQEEEKGIPSRCERCDWRDLGPCKTDQDCINAGCADHCGEGWNPQTGTSSGTHCCCDMSPWPGQNPPPGSPLFQWAGRGRCMGCVGEIHTDPCDEDPGNPQPSTAPPKPSSKPTNIINNNRRGRNRNTMTGKSQRNWEQQMGGGY